MLREINLLDSKCNAVILVSRLPLDSTEIDCLIYIIIDVKKHNKGMMVATIVTEMLITLEYSNETFRFCVPKKFPKTTIL